MPFSQLARSGAIRLCFMALFLCSTAGWLRAQRPHRRNVILFVADGLRRGSVDPDLMPTFAKLRAQGVDFRNSHSVFPTFTTANASAIATGHGLGDTGDYSNVIYPGVWLTKPDATAAASGLLTPFLESDDVLANMNSAFGGNYLGETTLLSAARQHGFNVASIGKLGPTAMQQNELVRWDREGSLSASDGVIIDDSTGTAAGLPLPPSLAEAMEHQGLSLVAPLRSNGYGDASEMNNGFSGDAGSSGTRDANRVQQQWFADIATRALLPQFAEENKPFVLLYWSRDPDGTQHNQGDSLQQTAPGINGATSRLALRNADHCLKQLLDWLDANPRIKAETDVVVTSDHGFATITRREIAADGTQTSEPSAALDYEVGPRERAEPKGTLPTGFLAVDLGIREHLRVFDTARRATTGPSVYQEVILGGERSQHPETGSALLGDPPQRLDGSDARLIIASNGGSDLIYAPTKDAALVRETLKTLGGLDYIGGLFVDESYCSVATDCPGALPLRSIGLLGSSKVARPAIVVAFKVFYLRPHDLQSALQISDTNLQEGQGMHGGFGRDSTWNNMAAIGPDFKRGFVDATAMGNIDLAPTLAKILGVPLPATGSLQGRVLSEAMEGGSAVKVTPVQKERSVPLSGGLHTILEYQEVNGVRYFDRACFVTKPDCD